TVMPALLSRSGNRTTRVAIVDASGSNLGVSIAAALASQKLAGDSAATPRYALRRVVSSAATIGPARDSMVAHTGVNPERDPQSLDGVLVLTDSTLRTGKLEYLGSNTSALETMGRLEESVSKVLMTTRLEGAGVDPSIMIGAMTPADMRTVKVSDGKATGQSGAASFLIAYFMGFLLYMTILIYGQQTLTSVIEEKTTRIMEVLVSSLRPFEMLLGKILGVGLTGLLQLTIWVGSVFVVTSERAHLAGLLHISADAMQQLPIPSMSADLLAVFLLYFVLGFLLYGSLYAAVGSMFNTVQEAQQVATSITVIIMVGFFALFAVIKDPTGGLGVTMSFIPFFSPFVMPARWSLTTVPPIELVVSVVLSLAALLAVTWLAGRIYRTGILMYGKKPSVTEVFRWIRAK
ncbi:MAG: ABC transporter permease, partial [Gemmatimonadales bacterium]